MIWRFLFTFALVWLVHIVGYVNGRVTEHREAFFKGADYALDEVIKMMKATSSNPKKGSKK